MNVKGIAFLQIKDLLIYKFGEERWNNFYEIFKESHRPFNQAILAITIIPVEEYIAFLDTMIKEFYNGDEKIYWILGKLAAKFTLKKGGIFHAFVRHKREPKDFIIKILHRVWNMFFDEGSVKYEVEGNIAHLHIFDVPLYHVFFEYSTMGYVQKALEIMGVFVKETIKEKGSAKETHYKFVLDL